MRSILSFCFENDDPASALMPFPLPENVSTLDQASKFLSEGAYTTFRTFSGRGVLRLDEHFHRLEASSKIAGFPLKVDSERWRGELREAIGQSPHETARIRIMVPFSTQKQMVHFFISALSVPGQDKREKGVEIVTHQFHRSTPEAKLTGFIQETDQLRKSLADGIEEVVMIDGEQRFLEGLTSNFYAVIDGEIFTAGEGILPGITRQIILEIAQSAGIKVRFSAVRLAEMHHFEEAFITSSSRAVLPVTKIDAAQIGDGKPGKITRKLMELYELRVQAELEYL